MPRKQRSKKREPARADAPRRSISLASVAAGVAALGVAGYVLAIRSSGPTIPSGHLSGHNVLVLTVDTLRADRVGAGLTPKLDRFAEEGIVFDNALSHVPLTLPSHASLFTSKNPTGHGVHDNGTFRLDDEHVTLASLVKQRGYDTGAFVGAFVLDARFGLDQGFDHYDDYYGEKRAFESFVELERRADAVLEPAEAWLLQKRERPWLAWIHLFDPHAPYEAPEPFRSRYPDDPYAAEVAYVDDALGAFLNRLEREGALEHTLVVFASDHGESLGEHGERTHGTFAYNATLHVPLFLWAKALEPARFPGRVGLVDVMPTALDLLGVNAPEDVDGESLRRFLYQPARYEPKTHYFEALNPHLTRDWAPLRGVVVGHHKFIDLPLTEIYDLETDPNEQENLATERAGLASELRQTLEAIVAAAAEPVSSAADAATLERLASLGYLVTPKTGERKTRYTERDDPKRLVAISNAHDRAGELFHEGRTDEAVALLRELLERQPRSSFAHQKLAYALRQLGRTREAVEVLETAMRNGVSDRSLHALVGSYLIEIGEPQKAAALLEILVEQHPDFAEARNTLGVAYGQTGNGARAESEFNKVLELDPSSATAYNNLGSLELARGNVPSAIDLFDAALAIDPEIASAHNGLGVAHARSGDLAAAASSWRRAVELEPGHMDALRNLAMVLIEIAPGQAGPYLERFVREAPRERYRADIERARRLLGEG